MCLIQSGNHTHVKMQLSIDNIRHLSERNKEHESRKMTSAMILPTYTKISLLFQSGNSLSVTKKLVSF